MKKLKILHKIQDRDNGNKKSTVKRSVSLPTKQNVQIKTAISHADVIKPRNVRVSCTSKYTSWYSWPWKELKILFLDVDISNWEETTSKKIKNKSRLLRNQINFIRASLIAFVTEINQIICHIAKPHDLIEQFYRYL